MRYARWIFLLWGLLVLAQPLGVFAATFTVGSGTAASCTETALNTALTSALAAQGTISFDCGASAHTITVTGTKVVSSSITIDGGSLITLSGGGTKTVFEITNHSTVLTLKNLTIADGYASSSQVSACNNQACGAGVSGQYRTSLTVINCVFKNNKTVGANQSNDYGGGAIYMHTGMLTVKQSQFLNNSAGNGTGGAIHLLHSNALVEDSTFDGNSSNSYGGVLYNDGTLNEDQNYRNIDGLLQFNRNIFSNNVGKGQGGAIFNFLYLNRRPNVLVVYDTNIFVNNSLGLDATNTSLGGALRVGNGPARIYNTLFLDNTALEQGGALWTGEISKVDIWNSTFSGNKAVGSSGTTGLGGAIAVSSSGMTLTNVTVVNNQAGLQAGGIRSKSNNVTLKNTIIANNTAKLTEPQNCNYTFSGNNNLQSPQLNNKDVPCAQGVVFANPQLAALANNGGFSQTFALLTNSPAIDDGNNAVCPVLDQRGKLRNIDGDGSGTPDCDMGAYEYRAFDRPAVSSGAPMINSVHNLLFPLTWTRVTWATAYNIEIASRATFAADTIVYSDSNLTQISTTVTVPDYGTYYWHVRVKQADGNWGQWSAPDVLVVMP